MYTITDTQYSFHNAEEICLNTYSVLFPFEAPAVTSVLLSTLKYTCTHATNHSKSIVIIFTHPVIDCYPVITTKSRILHKMCADRGSEEHKVQ